MSTAKIQNIARIPRPSSDTIDEKNIATICKDLRKDFIGCSKSFLAMTGKNLNAAVLLNQIIWSCGQNKKLYIYREQSAWEEEIGLTLREVQGALKHLKNLELLTTDIGRVRGITTTFYYPSWKYILQLDFEYTHGMLHNDERSRRIHGNDKKVIPENGLRGANLGNDKKVIPGNDKTVVPLEVTKGQFLNYSSEVNYSNRPSLIKKYANNNGSAINEGSQQTVVGSTSDNDTSLPDSIDPPRDPPRNPPTECWMPSHIWREHYGVTDLTPFKVKRSHKGMDGDDGLRYMLLDVTVSESSNEGEKPPG